MEQTRDQTHEQIHDLERKCNIQLERLEKITGWKLNVDNDIFKEIFVDIFHNENLTLDETQPNYNIRLSILGLYHYWIKTDHNMAKELWEISVRLSNPNTYCFLGMFYELSEQTVTNEEQAISNYKRAIEEGVNYAFIYLGNYYEKLGKKNDAIECYEYAIIYDIHEGFYWLGQFYLNKGNYKKAQEYFIKLIFETGNSTVEAIESMAQTCFLNCEYERALNYCLMAFIDNQHKGIRGLISNVLEQLGWDWENVCAEYVLTSPDWVTKEYISLNEKFSTHSHQNFRIYTKAIETNDVQTIIQIGNYYMKNGSKTNAFDCYVVAIEKCDASQIPLEGVLMLGIQIINDLQDYERANRYFKLLFDRGYFESLIPLMVVITKHLGKLERYKMLLDVFKTIVVENNSNYHLVFRQYVEALTEWKILNKLEEDGVIDSVIHKYFVDERKSLERIPSVIEFKNQYMRASRYQTKSQCVICMEDDVLDICIGCSHGVCYGCWKPSMECPFKCIVGTQCVDNVGFI